MFNKKRSCTCRHLLLVMTCIIALGGVFQENLFAKEDTVIELHRDLEILEIRGYTQRNNAKSELTDIPNSLKGIKNARVTTMSMKRFVAMREELNGKYDVIYIGSGTYSTSGVQGKDHNTTNVMNDITHLKAKEIKEQFIDKGQVLILHNDIFKNNNGNLKTYFGQYKGNQTDNVIVVNHASEVSATLNQNYVKGMINKRPFIDHLKFNFSSTPVPGDQGAMENTIEVEYRLPKNMDIGSRKLSAKIYLDANNNKRYESQELLISKQVNSTEGTLSYTLPPAYSGLRFVKFEIIDERSDLKDYREETIVLKGSQVKINVLQVTKNTDKSSDLNRFLKNKLGGPRKDYHINIDVVDMNTFKGSSYNDINGRYDMLIFGFSDSYNDSDIGRQTAQRVQDFIDTGQSVMFTHDTMFGQNNTWVNHFANHTGQIKPFHDLGNGAPHTSNETKGVNEGLIVNYPFKLQDSIRVATTHSQYYTLDLEDPLVIPWYNIVGGGRDEDDSWNHYYTYSKGTVTYSGTGHTSNQYHNFEKEMDLFVNTMYTAFFGANHAPIITMLEPSADRDRITINYYDSIDLKYIVDDLDLEDTTLNTRIYFDSKQVLNRSVPRGTTIEQSFANPMPSGGNFKIVIEATDQLGARAEKVIHVVVEGPESSDLQINRSFKPDKINLGKKSILQYTINFPELLRRPNENIDSISLSNQLPKGLEVNEDQLPEGWSISGSVEKGYSLTATLPSVKYGYRNGKYKANELIYSIEVEPLDNGEYKLEGGYIQFNDIDGEDKTISLNTAILTVETRVTELKLDDHIIIKKGESTNLTVEVLPHNATNKDVKWISSNPEIADAVLAGNQWEVVVRGHQIGQTTITVVSLDNEEIQDDCVVDVIYPLEGIRIEPSEATLRVGQTLALTAIFEPEDALNKNVTWSSGNTKIATVNEDGVVVALRQGTAVITVTTEEGALTAHSVITVKPLIDPPDSSHPTLAGVGYVHPLSLANINMTMQVESELRDATLTMEIPDTILLFEPTRELMVKLNNTDLDSSRYGVKNNKTITIKLGDLQGVDNNPTKYDIAIYIAMKPSASLGNINNYNHQVEIGNQSITVSNMIKAKVDIGGLAVEIDIDLEEYKLHLIKIPDIH